MTNKELQDMFKDISLNTNSIFDAYTKLKALEAEYKKSDFYKEFKKSIYDAYELYTSHEGRIDSILNLITNIDDNNRLDELLAKIADTFDMNKVLNTMEGDNKKLFTELLPFIQK